LENDTISDDKINALFDVIKKYKLWHDTFQQNFFNSLYYNGVNAQ
jgi:hypothetical protein